MNTLESDTATDSVVITTVVGRTWPKGGITAVTGAYHHAVIPQEWGQWLQ